MIHYYGVTQQGAYHIKNNIICQDHHAVKVLGEHFSVAAVADGLGSELYSDVASKIAAEKSIDYVCKNINEGSSAEDIIKIIKFICIEANRRNAYDQKIHRSQQ